MSRHIISREPDLGKFSNLISELQKELRSPGSQQPIILEERIAATGSRHVYVIWEEWSNVPDEVRSQIILQAYRTEESEETPEITIAVGVTPWESLALGLLPYQVRPLGATALHEECNRAIQHESKHTILGELSLDLRYTTLDAAEEGKMRLEHLLPGSNWSIVQEIETGTG